MGDLGGYGIAELPPAGPLFARGPYRALGQKGNPWEVVRNSISAHVTHAEITHFCLVQPVQISFPISPESPRAKMLYLLWTLGMNFFSAYGRQNHFHPPQLYRNYPFL